MSAAAQRVQTPAVILLHPLFGNRQGDAASLDLIELARCWCAAGYAVLLFDFRNHGQSGRGAGAGGYSEDQDVTAAVGYVFTRLAAATADGEPQVGIVSFGLGASAAVAAIGREKGDSRTIRVFNADQEGSSGFIEFPPADVKKLRFLVLVEPASPAGLLRAGSCAVCRPLRGPLGSPLLALANRISRLRGGYGLDAAPLVGFARHIHTPVLYVHAAGGAPGVNAAQDDVARLYAATPGPKQMWEIVEPLDPPAVYAHVARQPDRLPAFAEGQVNCAPTRRNGPGPASACAAYRGEAAA